MTEPTLPPLQTTEPGFWRHYKGGHYQVLATVRHSETLESLTLYRALYGAQELWVRPSAMFSEEVTYQGVRQPRFVRLGDAPTLD